jgi:hypothetical protein
MAQRQVSKQKVTPALLRSWGKSGGTKTFETHGAEHMATIGKRGAATFWKRYTVKPAGTSGWVILRRDTKEVINFIGSIPGISPTTE